MTLSPNLDYYYLTMPNAPSFGFKARARGPRTAARAAVTRDLVSVCPARYIAAAADTAVRRYDAIIGSNFLSIYYLSVEDSSSLHWD